jgi:SAM-dependent methyltransferase
MTQWARVVMTQRTGELVAPFDTGNMDALEISGDSWHHRHQWKSFQTVYYPAFDICGDAIYDRQFDIIFAEQVFEHLLYPYRAVRNVHRMLRPGGYFLITLPFLVRIHLHPTDCSRWTSQGLPYFLEECGFERSRIKADSWGNRACIISNFEHWTGYDPELHSLANEPNFPIVVWALAQK